jgi:hypothetical protein
MHERKGSALTRFTLLVFFAVISGAVVASSQTQGGTPTPDGANQEFLTFSPPVTDDPVAQVRKNQSWEYGPFLDAGNGFGNRDDYRFLSAGFQAGKVLTPVIGHGILAGQFEYGANIMPLWLAFTPAQNPNAEFLYPNGTSFTGPLGGGTYIGASLTPVILRWNFLSHSRRLQPWFQGAGGLIYTTHKFPPDLLIPHGQPGGTSVFNFSPQGGGGVHYFLRPGRSIDLGINGVHISSASLGDRNPGVNALIQVQLGYTFWK